MTDDPSRWLTALSQTVTRALMDGAFVLCFETDDASPLDGPLIEASVRMSSDGRPTIVIALQLPMALARQLALDTLGETDPGAITDADATDTVLELANVVAGGLASAVIPAGTLCTIAPPSTTAALPHGLSALGLLTDAGARIRVLVGEEGA
jgi:hypothetical protein